MRIATIALEKEVQARIVMANSIPGVANEAM